MKLKSLHGFGTRGTMLERRRNKTKALVIFTINKPVLPFYITNFFIHLLKNRNLGKIMVKFLKENKITSKGFKRNKTMDYEKCHLKIIIIRKELIHYIPILIEATIISITYLFIKRSFNFSDLLKYKVYDKDHNTWKIMVIFFYISVLVEAIKLSIKFVRKSYFQL